jgi:hypothetical protein
MAALPTYCASASPIFCPHAAAAGVATTPLVAHRLQCYHELQALEERFVENNTRERVALRKMEMHIATLLFTSGD